MKDNAFTAVSDPDALSLAAKEIDGKLVRQRIDYWMNLFFRFDKGKYATRSKHLHHDWYLAQVEVCSNVIFKSARFCTSLFERLLDKFSRVGLPGTIAKIFSLRPARSHSKSFSSKTCPLFTGMPIGLGCNNRLLNCCADVDLPSIYDGEAALFDQPVMDHKGMKITAPDLRKDRQLSLCRELLKPKYAVHGFRTIDLKKALSEFSNSAQIRYEMVKLISRGEVQKQKNKSFYRVTPTGWKWLRASICSKLYFKNPVIATISKTTPTKLSAQPYILEQGVSLINQGLSYITQGLAMNM